MKTLVDLNRLNDEVTELELNNSMLNADDYPILLYGSSTFAVWRREELCYEQLAPLKIINNGFGGSTAEDALYNYHRLVKPYKPKILVYYEGDNDTYFGYNTKEVITYTDILFNWARQDMPGIKFVIVPAKPAPGTMNILDKLILCNKALTDFANKHSDVYMISVDKLLFNDKGDRREDIFLDDMLHQNLKGYGLLTDCLKPLLVELVNEI